VERRFHVWRRWERRRQRPDCYGDAAMEVADRIRTRGGSLTAAERRVAEAILASPQAVGFGTVADLAGAAGAGAATVVRLATKLGFDGFSELQTSIQRDLLHQLRPAAERIREQSGDTVREKHVAVQTANVRATLDSIDDVALDELVGRLAEQRHPVAVISGDASDGVARVLAAQLSMLRPAVSLLDGSEVAVRRDIALLARSSLLVVIDLRRYDRWVLDAVEHACARGVTVAALTDSILSPLAAHARWTFVLSAGSLGPFDSHVGTLALVDLLVTETSARLRRTATGRLDAVERAWREGDSLVDT
jgi:DNA-binding MurR/RpiR family transcriptional regulator